MKQNHITRRAFALSSIALTALALSSFATVSAAEKIQKKKLQIFILLGQSNMVGRYPDGFGPLPGAENDG